MSDSTWIRSYGSKNIYQNTGIMRTDGQFQVGDSGSKFYANSSGNGYFSNTLGIGGTNTSYKLYVNGASYFNNNVTVPVSYSISGILGQCDSAAATNAGGLSWYNLQGVSSTTINAHDTPSSSATWWYILRNRHTNTGNNHYTDLAIPFNANTIYYKRVTGNTGSETIANASTNNGWVAVLDQLNYTNYTVTKTGTGASGTWGISISGTATNATNVNIANDTSSKLFVLGATTTGNTRIYRESSVYMQSNVLYGAAWNDYAEYRITKEKIEPGRCVREVGDDTLELTTKRLERGCEIVSDTFGFAIGETDDSKTPIAATGRVLAYLYEGREAARTHIGWPVCSGPSGTVSIMTEEEEEKYPSRIIGTISAVPNYDTWGEGNVKVNGRVWIRIR